MVSDSFTSLHETSEDVDSGTPLADFFESAPGHEGAQNLAAGLERVFQGRRPGLLVTVEYVRDAVVWGANQTESRLVAALEKEKHSRRFVGLDLICALVLSLISGPRCPHADLLAVLSLVFAAGHGLLCLFWGRLAKRLDKEIMEAREVAEVYTQWLSSRTVSVSRGLRFVDADE